MANLRNNILNTLKNKDNSNNTIKYLSSIQSNLIKNSTNPVFKEKDKNKLLQKYGKLEQIGKTLYRYNIFKQNNMLKEAEIESGNVSNLVLQGGISNFKYVWHSENSKNTCNECAALDGTEYNFEDEVPERPHPNCHCWVEIVEDIDENNEPDEEDKHCDCCKTAEKLEEIISEAENLTNEVEYEIADIENVILGAPRFISEKIQSIVEKLINRMEELSIQIQTVSIFISNFQQLLDIEDGTCDKYYHAKANYEAAQLGVTGEATAKALSDDYKELFDSTVKAIVESVKLKTDFQQALIEKIQDSEDDQKANNEGREAGKNNPYGDCGEILKHKLPKKRL